MAEEQDTGAAEQPKTSHKFWLIAVAVGLLLGLGGGAWFFYRRASAQENPKPPSEPEVKAFVHLENFLVNLADAEGRRYLRVGIDLGLEHQPGESQEGQDPLQTALIRDTILAVLATWNSDPLLTPEGKAKLKRELVQALREQVPKLGVREVYFNEFLVQR